jgi:hypothetical protein
MANHSISKEQYMRVWLTEALLIWFAIAWLGLVFVPMLILPSHDVNLMESNLAMLSVEIGICIFAIVWGIKQFLKRTKQIKHEN